MSPVRFRELPHATEAVTAREFAEATNDQGPMGSVIRRRMAAFMLGLKTRVSGFGISVYIEYFHPILVVYLITEFSKAQAQLPRKCMLGKVWLSWLGLKVLRSRRGMAKNMLEVLFQEHRWPCICMWL